MKYIFLVFAGSGLGGVCRYLISTVFKDQSYTFPVQTFLVNVAGCFLLGIVYALFDKNEQFSESWKIALTTGFCGGFTTFSAFGFENFSLINNGQIKTTLVYTIGSLVLGILSVFGGVYLVKNFL